MNGLNAEFVTDPKKFLETYLVDNTVLQQGVDGAATLEILNGIKEGGFDFQPGGTGRVIFSVIGPRTMSKVEKDVPIDSYWCPFLSGGGQPGWVDVPRANPSKQFIFTAAMQGCWFVVTDAEAGTNFRVHHNQHPDTDSTWEAMKPPTTKTSGISTLEYDEYGDPAGESAATATNAFNLIYRSAGSWHYLSQTQKFVPSAKGFAVARDSRFPILKKDTGV